MKKILLIGLLVMIPLTLFAQVMGVDPPVIQANLIENPLPTEALDLIDSVMVLITTFQSAWFLGVALSLFLLMNLIRGKLRIGAWTVKVPKFTDWLEGTGKKFKSYFIIGLTGLGMAFAALQTVEVWEVMIVIKAMLGGLLAGVQLALAALGINNLKKNHKKDVV